MPGLVTLGRHWDLTVHCVSIATETENEHAWRQLLLMESHI